MVEKKNLKIQFFQINLHYLECLNTKSQVFFWQFSCMHQAGTTWMVENGKLFNLLLQNDWNLKSWYVWGSWSMVWIKN